MRTNQQLQPELNWRWELLTTNQQLQQELNWRWELTNGSDSMGPASTKSQVQKWNYSKTGAIYRNWCGCEFSSRLELPNNTKPASNVRPRMTKNDCKQNKTTKLEQFYLKFVFRILVANKGLGSPISISKARAISKLLSDYILEWYCMFYLTLIHSHRSVIFIN